MVLQDRAVYADTARANFFRPGGDHLTLLSVYNEVNCPGKTGVHCNRLHAAVTCTTCCCRLHLITDVRARSTAVAYKQHTNTYLLVSRFCRSTVVGGYILS